MIQARKFVQTKAHASSLKKKQPRKVKRLVTDRIRFFFLQKIMPLLKPQCSFPSKLIESGFRGKMLAHCCQVESTAYSKAPFRNSYTNFSTKPGGNYFSWKKMQFAKTSHCGDHANVRLQYIRLLCLPELFYCKQFFSLR